MTARVVDPAEVAERFRAEVRIDVANLVSSLGRRPRIAGLLSQADGPARTYAEYARRGCEAVGIAMDLREVAPDEAVRALQQANADPGIDGLFLYYPVAGPADDRWLRELVDPRKDVEGMHSFWSRLLYENRRYLEPDRLEADHDAADRARRAILPCTPLAILKLLEAAGVHGTTDAAPLAGVTACVINRSEIVGRPLSAMLANDGAEVISLDLSGAVVFEPALGRHAHQVRDTDLDRAEALARADVVITGVPSRDFPLVTAAEIKPGAVCVNFSQFRNFDDSILEAADAFVPRVGPMTVTMATRNLVRLIRTFGAVTA